MLKLPGAIADSDISAVYVGPAPIRLADVGADYGYGFPTGLGIIAYSGKHCAPKLIARVVETAELSSKSVEACVRA